MSGPVFYNLATLDASVYSMFLLVLVVSLVSAVSFWSFRWYIDDFGWVVSLASLVSVVAFVVSDVTRSMIFDVICPCLKRLRRSTQRVDSMRLSALKQFPNVHTFSVSNRLLFLPICLALSLSVVFFS